MDPLTRCVKRCKSDDNCLEGEICSLESNTCVADGCEADGVSNGAIEAEDSAMQGDEATLVCHKGYVVNSGGNSENQTRVVCRDGMWTWPKKDDREPVKCMKGLWFFLAKLILT